MNPVRIGVRLASLLAVVVMLGCSSGDDTGAPLDSDASPSADAAAPTDSARDGGEDAAIDASDALPYFDVLPDGEVDAGPHFPCAEDDECPALLVPTRRCERSVCRGGGCVLVDAPNGAACDDGLRCTAGDTCEDGACVAGALDTCEDGNPCTDDRCTEDADCVHTENDRSCDDANPCTVLDRCSAGACRGTPAPEECPCAGDGDCASYDDGDRCDGTFVCSGGGCVEVGPVMCEAPVDPCRRSTCDPTTGVCAEGAAPAGTACDDGDACTEGDVCTDSVCAGTPGGCDCLVHDDCASFDDGDRCNGIWHCSGGQCTFAAETIVDCGEPTSACRRRVCQPETGACREVELEAGAPCDDGDACTEGESCAAGVCRGGTLVACDDGNPCTYDRCDVFFGCLTVAAPLDCDDGDPCTRADRCTDGVCRGSARDCDDGDPCTADSCQADLGGCVHAPTPAECTDGNPCTVGDTCVDGRCFPGTVDACGTCVTNAECFAYEDGDLCNGILSCREGLCRIDPMTVVTCTPSSSPCRISECIPMTGVCRESSRPDGFRCDDGSPCTVNGTCSDGLCVTESTTCDDSNVCTVDACDRDLGCVHTPRGGTCDDGNRCTRNDQCSEGVCRPGASDDCGACTLDADCSLGDDLNACNGAIRCAAGRCVLGLGTLVTCPATGADSCTVASCDAATGACGAVPAEAGAPCDDADECTRGDACTAAGACLGATLGCDDGNPCTEDTCDALLGCRHAPVAPGTACEDGNACTTVDTCVAGVCGGGVPVDCDDDNPCTTDLCDVATGTCSNVENAVACDDGDACTVGDTCTLGECVGRLVTCEDGNPCTDDVCDPAEGCVHHALGATDCEGGPCECDDGEPCTIGDSCDSGFCRSGTVACGERCGEPGDEDNDGLADCDDPDCDPLPWCRGEGACEPVLDVGCLDTVNGSLTGEGATDQVDSYPTGVCVGADYAGPEMAFRFVPDCDGIGHARLTVAAAANPTRPRVDVFVIRADPQGNCIAATGCVAKGIIQYIGQLGTAEALFLVEAGQTYYLVADGQSGATAEFSLEAICYCN